MAATLRDLQIMAAIVRLRDNAYARCIGEAVGTSALQRPLQRLTAAGLVHSWWSEPLRGVQGGRRRRIYGVTTLGMRVLDRERNTITLQV